MAFASSIRLAKLDDVETAAWTDKHFSNNTSFDWAEVNKMAQVNFGHFWSDQTNFTVPMYWTKDIF